MLMLLAMPVVFCVESMYQYLARFAPTDLHVRRARAQQPRWLTAAMLMVLAIGLGAVKHAVAESVARGAPGWLNLVVLVAACHTRAIKSGATS